MIVPSPPVPRPIQEVIEANIRRHALARRMSLDEVAQASSISTARLLAILDGTFDPDLQMLGRIAEAMGVTAADLLEEPKLN